MLEAAVVTKIIRKRDVMALLGISEQTYKTFIENGLLMPIRCGKKYVFDRKKIIKAFDLEDADK